MSKDRTSTLLAALRTLKSAFDLQRLHYSIAIDDSRKWISERDGIIIGICYDIYVRILSPCLKDYQKGLLSSDEQRMLAGAIKIIDEEGDFFISPWNREEDTLVTPSKTILEYLNKCREAIRGYINALKVTDIAHLAEIAGDFIKTLSPDSQILDNRIVLKIPDPEDRPYKKVLTFEMEIIEENYRIDVSPNVSGSFNHLFESKINIETGEILKTRYDLDNYTIDIADIINSC